MIKGGFSLPIEESSKIYKYKIFPYWQLYRLKEHIKNWRENMFKTKMRKEIDSLIKLTQMLDNEVRGVREQYHNLYDSFDEFVRILGYTISIEKKIPRKVIIIKKSNNEI